MRQLRPYQTEAVDAVRKTLEQHGSTVVVLPTGTGKTSVASKLMNEWPAGNCLFIAHTCELIDQAAKRLAEDLGYPPIVEMGIRGGDPSLFYMGGMVVVGSVQSMLTDRRLEKYRAYPFDLIVIDECHRAVSASYRKIVDFFREANPACKSIGLTATPNRADRIALGLAFDSVAYSMDIPTAINEGYLVDVVESMIVVSDADMPTKTRKNEMGESDYKDEDVEKIMMEGNAIMATARPIIEMSGDRQTIVYTATVRHAYVLAAVLNELKPGSAIAVDGTTPKDQRHEAVAEFHDAKKQYLVNAQLYVEGFDSPNCSCIAIARMTKSTGRYTQMVGRGLRPLPGIVDENDNANGRKTAIKSSAKPDCLVIDFVNAGAVGLVKIDDILGGDYDAETRALAEEDRRENKTTTLSSLARAKMLIELEREARIIAKNAERTEYEAITRDGRPIAPGNIPNYKRGTITDGQYGFLVSIGCDKQRAYAMSKQQAAIVIDSMRKTHCTVKQAAVLKRSGVDPVGIGCERASRIIDALKANAWERPHVLPA